MQWGCLRVRQCECWLGTATKSTAFEQKTQEGRKGGRKAGTVAINKWSSAGSCSVPCGVTTKQTAPERQELIPEPSGLVTTLCCASKCSWITQFLKHITQTPQIVRTQQCSRVHAADVTASGGDNHPWRINSNCSRGHSIDYKKTRETDKGRTGQDRTACNAGGGGE